MKYILLFISCFGIYSENTYAKIGKPKWTVFSDLKAIKVIESPEDKVTVGDWICSIGSINTDKFGNESRRFGCSIDGKPEAFVNPICSYSKSHKRFIGSDTGFNLQMKHQPATFASLGCSDQM